MLIKTPVPMLRAEIWEYGPSYQANKLKRVWQ
jgi:hypothetical protein